MTIINHTEVRMNTVIENELFLTTEYIRKHSLLPAALPRTEGDSLVCGYLQKTLNALEIPESQESGSEIWYVASPEKLDENTLKDVVNNSLKENKTLLLIILSKNIPSNPTIQKYAEMEYIAFDDRLKMIRELILSLTGCSARNMTLSVFLRS